MKISLILIGSVSATALAGIAVAQATRAVWPQLDIADLEQCRPVIAQVHRLEQAYIRDVTTRECNAPARYYSTESCRTARRWLSKTESQDDVVWYFEGNDRCQGTDYPCFGIKIYNTPRSGVEAQRWARYFLDKSAKPYRVTRGMDLWTAAREADTCVSGVWASRYRMANAPPEPPPVQVAEAPPLPIAAAPPAATPAVEASEAVSAAPAVQDAASAAGIAAAAAPSAAVAAAAAEAAAATTVAAATSVAATAALASDPATEAAPAAAAPAEAAATQAAAAPPPAASVAAAPVTATLKPAKKGSAGKETIQQVSALIDEGKTAEAIALGDRIAAGQSAGDAQLTACRTRVMAKQDLDRALVACYSTGKPGDPAVLEMRGQLHLLAGRHQDAWNDFNAALSANESNSTLYLRGLASAGMGKTVDALKDLATAEAGEKGIMAAYEAKGYSLASVMAGKPLVDASAMAAPVAAAAAAPAAPVAEVEVAAAPTAAPAATPAADEPIVSLPNSVRPPADDPPPTAVPAAPVVPLPNAVYPPATEVAPAVPAAPAPTAPEVAVPVSTPAPAAAAAAEPATFAASTGSAVAVPGVSLPAVTDCLVPVAPGSGGKGAFKNKCNYPVRFTYCNIKGADSVPQLTCGSDTKFRAETIGGNGSIPAVLGLSVAYFACRSPTLPEVIYTSNNGLEGYCR
jgi:hypothetical protein